MPQVAPQGNIKGCLTSDEILASGALGLKSLPHGGLRVRAMFYLTNIFTPSAGDRTRDPELGEPTRCLQRFREVTMAIKTSSVTKPGRTASNCVESVEPVRVNSNGFVGNFIVGRNRCRPCVSACVVTMIQARE